MSGGGSFPTNPSAAILDNAIRPSPLLFKTSILRLSQQKLEASILLLSPQKLEVKDEVP